MVPDCTECLGTRFDLSPLFLELPRIGRYAVIGRAYYTECFPSVFSERVIPAEWIGKRRRKRVDERMRKRRKEIGNGRKRDAKRGLFLSRWRPKGKRGRERKIIGHDSCYFVNEASDTSADDVHEQVVIDRLR